MKPYKYSKIVDKIIASKKPIEDQFVELLEKLGAKVIDQK